MKYYIIAGEASGDMHAANLIAELKKKDAKAEFRAWGGDLMKKQGATLVKHYRYMAFMGFVEVAVNLRKVLNNIKECKQDMLKYKPDAVILVDYPGFNLRMAKFAHEHGIKVFYYVSPQVWAWKRRRVYQIQKSVDKMLVILPFEETFYRKYGVDVTYVGHPLLDQIAKVTPVPRQSFSRMNNLSEKQEIIALLPGSRVQELKRTLKTMLEVVPKFPDYQFVIAKVPSLDIALYESLIGKANVHIVENQTYELLQHASAALVTSGTATLETALFTVPEVVCYKATGISYRIARWLIRVKYICLVNLILDKAAVKELIQHDFTAANIEKELDLLLHDFKRQRRLLEDYETLKDVMGAAGASARAAEVIFARLK
ncbi:MAG: lipid-A-disaccharide synthase [Bacteroidales bacterium]|nr:lipid-A-disaccharide synthase [Bacteroidales bacterium]